LIASRKETVTLVDDRRSKTGMTGSPPTGTRLYAIGDIHGRRDLLVRLHEQILSDAARATAQRFVIVYLGDYVDRGPDSKGVIDLLLNAPLPGFEAIHLMGNHELEMFQFVQGDAPRFDWLNYGGLETLRSYGVEPPRKLAASEQIRAIFAAALPDAHRAFFHGLRYSHQEGDFFMAHAGVVPGISLDEQKPDDLMWIRAPFLKSDTDFGKVVIHGHTIVERPEIRSNRIGIDTGAFRSGRLTAIVLQGGTMDFLKT
jgi:serine/threonine protein phosphatase 1